MGVFLSSSSTLSLSMLVGFGEIGGFLGVAGLTAGDALFEEILFDGRRDDDPFEVLFFGLSGELGGCFLRTFSPFCPTRFFSWSKILIQIDSTRDEIRSSQRVFFRIYSNSRFF